MGFSSASQWWDEYQLQVLVLASLMNQCFLVIAAGLRRHRTPPYFKLLIWLSFLGSDAIALLALAAPTLQWKLQQCSSTQRNHDLEVFWAPILLMHLGGQMCISAYNLEDNELWSQHALTSSVKVALAVYVFWKSWSTSADHWLLAAAVLLFISGVVKCVDRPLSLKNSSFESLSTIVNEEAQGEAVTGVLGLEEYVERARNFFQSAEANNMSTNINRCCLLPQKLIVDFSHSYSDRLINLTCFWALKDNLMYLALITGITDCFELLYTKIEAPVKNTSQANKYFTVTLGSAIVLPIVAIVLFHVSSKQAYRVVDIVVTLVLLYGTVAVEIISVWLMTRSQFWWPDMVAQHNIFGFFAHNKRHSKLMRFAGWFQCKDLVEKYWCMDPSYDSQDITRIVRQHIKILWTDFIKDAENYMHSTNVRGHWVLEGLDCDGLAWSVEKPFDESVILWHIATDFCCFLSEEEEPLSPDQGRCKEMSNYMMHLLFADSEMLLPGSRKSMFTAAYKQLGEILVDEEEGALDDAKGLVQKVIAKLQSDELPEEASLFHDAWSITEDLMGLDDADMWLVIQGVWVEMLCFSAGRCRGYLHAKSLGSSGGEYLSFVSLLLTYTGLPTLADRVQTARPFRRRPPAASRSTSDASGSLPGMPQRPRETPPALQVLPGVAQVLPVPGVAELD